MPISPYPFLILSTFPITPVREAAETKPVGTIHLAVAGLNGHKHRHLLWQGPRAIVKWYSTQQALDLLRRSILKGP